MLKDGRNINSGVIIVAFLPLFVVLFTSGLLLFFI